MPSIFISFATVNMNLVIFADEYTDEELDEDSNDANDVQATTDVAVDVDDGVNYSDYGKNKIAVRNNAGKTTPAATAPMANSYANATILEKIENLAAIFRQRKCNETSSRFLFLNIKENDKSYQTP
ncbi:hypothetical protein Bca101_030593 [Brassica carinata]